MKKFYLLLMLGAVVGFLSSCSSPKPVKTIENLKAAFKGESTASAKYAAYAQKAKEEGFNAVATLFEAASKAESIHAGNHAKVLEKLGEKVEPVNPVVDVKSTKENLMDAINGESYEMTTMYPGFIATANEEKSKDAVTSFTWAMDTEKKHHAFYQATLTTLDAGDMNTLPTNFYVCPKCGNTWDGATVKAVCDFCQTKQESFIKF
jgi:rubrerythrin